MSGPLLVPTNIDLDGAAIRTASVGSWAVAWDAPGLPGHDTFNRPCAECGRGVAGFAEFATGPDVSAPGGSPLRIDYDDGSYVEVGYFVGDDRLPPDRPQFTTVDTNEPTLGGYQAMVMVSDGRQYLLWSHLGLDHLLEMIDGLREIGW